MRNVAQSAFEEIVRIDSDLVGKRLIEMDQDFTVWEFELDSKANKTNEVTRNGV